MARQKGKYLLSLIASLFVVLTLSMAPTASAANTPTLNQTINAGTLSTDILDEGGTSVVSPAYTMTAKNFAFTCQSGGDASTGVMGHVGSRIYVINPGGANSGWTLTIAPTSGAGTTWTSGGNSFDFNDASGSGCTDNGTDTDTKGGQLTIDPSVGTLAAACASCTTANVTKGTSTAFVEATTDSVTLLSASAASDDVWRGNLIGTTLSQTIPAETPGGAYTLNMTLTATAL